MSHAEVAGATRPSEAVLDPIDRTGEILLGLIMVLTFTVSFDAVEAGKEDTRALVIGALACNLAWGIIDASTYLISTFMKRARGLVTLRAVLTADQTATAHRLIRDAVPSVIADVLEPADLEVVRARLSGMANPAALVRVHRSDFAGAVGVFLIVFLSTFPVVIPFLFIGDAATALRTSNVVALAMLYLTGSSLGKYAGRVGWRSGLGMVVVGIALVVVAAVLGG